MVLFDEILMLYWFRMLIDYTFRVATLMKDKDMQRKLAGSKRLKVFLANDPATGIDDHSPQRSARLSSLVLTSRSRLCLLKPISVLVHKD